MSAVDVLVPARAVFHPVVDLGTGTVVAVEAHAGPPAATGGLPPRVDPVSEDLRRAAEAARAAADLRTPLPLQIGLRAETLAFGDPVLAELHQGFAGAGRRPQEIIICVTGGFPPAQRAPVAAALSALRRAGYLVGLGGVGAAHAPLDLLVEGASYLLKLDPGLARRAPSEPRRSALVASLVELAHRLETHVLAPGLETGEQVLHLRELGVRLVQGPALAPPEWRPGMPSPSPSRRAAPRIPATAPTSAPVSRSSPSPASRCRTPRPPKRCWTR
ncbi:EAL domain-containing protein [Actinomadura sp. LD22]|uniref:EAL domain-containing protein n=1 Tax=Actinomadura physcomitrii TaxID=2650748 RepID=A0A6I4M301_9ACTN|nr:EAL domain-containing protein [Actinomadura physcomitrii]MWA00388.1 EAL domain-containing protein [Actinomadura physcomitrii]